MDVALKVLVLTRSAPASMNWRWMSAMTSGCVMTSRSLQPLRSRAWLAKRAPRNAASSSLCCWIMVPMAPSRMTMRWPNNSRNCPTRSCASGADRCVEVLTAISGTGGLALHAGPHAERVADGVGELGTVQRVEMELLDAMPLQRVHLLDG